jgi:type II secretory pathway component GspD/PulD (secretin)
MGGRGWVGARQRQIMLAVALTLLPASVIAQQQQPSPQRSKNGVTGRPSARTTPSWRVRVSKSIPATLTLRAKDAPLTEIAAEIGRQLGVPVVLSPVMKLQRLTVEIKGLPLETFMKSIAPQPYADFVLTGGQQQPSYLALYLYAYNEKPPAIDAAVKGNSQAVLIQGTFGEEDNAAQATKPDEPLQVTVENNLLSVVARKQPLAYVLAEIAEKYGFPFEMEFETNELVDITFSKYTLEQTISSLTPNVRLYFRTDLQTYQTKPLRLVLGAPGKS